MNAMTSDMLVLLVRTTVGLTLAVVIVGFVLRTMRIASPTVHRWCWFLCLALGWAFIGWSIEIPWYESQVVATVVEPDSAPTVYYPTGEPSPAPPAESSVVPYFPLPPVEDVAHSSIVKLPVDDTAPLDDAVPLDYLPAVAPAPVELAAAPPIASEPIEMAAPVDDLATIEPASALLWQAWPLLLAGVWLAGIAVFVLLWIVGYALFLRRIARRQAHAAWESEWIALLSGSECASRIPLRVTENLGPMLCRLPRGYELLVPEALWADLDTEGRLAILRHELAHYQRGDVWKSIGMRLLALPHWFNPCAWYATRRFDEAAEWACDLAAAADDQPTRYARMLLKLGEGAQRHAAYSPAMSGHALASRIRRLLTPHHDDSILKKLFIALTITALLIAATLRLQLVAKEPAAEESAAQTAQAETNEAQSQLVELEPLAPAESNNEAESAAARKLQPLDVLRVLVEGTPPESPIQGAFLIEPDGHIVLPAGYGRVKVEGLTRAKAEQALLAHLEQILESPDIVTSWLGQARLFQRVILPDKLTTSIGEKYRVQIDHLSPPFDKVIEIDREGRLVLGPGLPAPTIAGMTIPDATSAVVASLEGILSSPEALITPANLVRTYVEITSPREQLQIAPGTLLRIQVEGTPPEHPIDGEFVVYPDRTIALGLGYGTVEAGNTTAETAERIQQHLNQILSAPDVSVSLAGWNPDNLVTGQNAVDIPAQGAKPAGAPRPAVNESELVAAARKTYETVAAGYQVGAVTLGMLVEWSERWMNAALEDAQTAPAHVEAAQSHLARMQTLRDEIKNLHDMEARGGEADKLAAMDFHVAAAKRRLEAMQQQLPARQQSGDSQASDLAPVAPIARPILIEGPTQVAVGDEVTFNITYTNLGEEPLRKVKAAVMPAGEPGVLTPLKATKGARLQQEGNQDFNWLIWDIDELAPEASRTFEVVYRCEKPAQSTILQAAIEAEKKPRHALTNFNLKITSPSTFQAPGIQLPATPTFATPPSAFQFPAALDSTAPTPAIALPSAPAGATEIPMTALPSAPPGTALPSATQLPSAPAPTPQTYPPPAAPGQSLAQPAPASRSDATGPRYDGKSFDHWATILENDLSPESRAQAIRALAAIGTRERAQDAARLIIKAMRGFDTRVWDIAGVEWAPLVAAHNAFAQNENPSLPHLPVDAALKAAIEALASDNADERLFATQIIMKLKMMLRADVAPAAPALVRATQDADPRVRSAALRTAAFVDKTSPELHQAVRDMLTSNNPQDVMTAVDFLMASRPSYAPHLTSDAFEEELKKAVPAMVAIFEDAKQDVQLRGHAILALRKMGPRAAQAVPALERLADSPDAEQTFSASPLDAIADTSVTLHTGEDAPTEMTLAAVAKLALQDIRPEPRQPPRAGGGMGARGGATPAPAAGAVRPVPAVPPVSVPPTARYDNKPFGDWATILENDLSPESRAQAIQALTALSTRERPQDAARVIIQAMSDFNARDDGAEGRGKVVREALNAFRPTDGSNPRIPADVAAPALVAALKSDSANQRLFAVHALSRMVLDNPELLAELMPATSDDDPRVRGDAIWTINISPQGRSLPGFDEALRRLLQDSDLDALRQTMQCFRYYPEGETYLDRAKYADELAQAGRTLVQVVTDPDSTPFERSTALTVLDHIGPQAAGVIPDLKKLAESPQAAKQKIQHYLDGQQQTISLAKRVQITIEALHAEQKADSETTSAADPQ